MTPRGFTIIAVATLAAVVAAGASLSGRSTGKDAALGGAVFPGLIERINDVATVVLEHNAGVFTMQRGAGGAWSMEESDGYPVDAARARKMVVELADLKLVEAKTRQKAKYVKLQLNDPSEKQSEARRVRLLDAKGAVMAEAILGRIRYDMPGLRSQGVYLRKPDDPQSWLAVGSVSVAAAAREWLQRSIVDIAEDQVASVELVHPNGERLRVAKDDPKAANFTLQGTPEGKALKYESDPNNIAAMIEKLQLEDARKAEKIAFDVDKTTLGAFVTRAGMTLNIKLTKAADGKEWIRVSAAAPAGSPSAELADRINARADGWAFEIPGYKAARMRKRMADIIKDAKAPGS